MFENKSYLVFAYPVLDLTIARYLAARNTDFIGLLIDFENMKKTQNVIQQFKEWLEGPKLIGIYEDAQELSELEGLDGYYHPILKMFYSGRIDRGLLNATAPELIHDPLYCIVDKQSDSNEQYFNFLELDLGEDPRDYKNYKGFVIHPGFEKQTGVYDFEMLDNWFDRLDMMQNN